MNDREKKKPTCIDKKIRQQLGILDDEDGD